MTDGKAIVRRVLRAMETGDEAEFDAVIADDYIQHNHLGNGREPVKKMVGSLRRAFPDLKVVVEDLLAEGDRVVARVTITGTHQGRFLGVDPTEKPITLRSVDIWRIEGDRLKEHWDVVDRLDFMQQLGLVRGAKE
jgi:steroid delta-isomerase-like uncharacterized protein